MSAKKCRDAAPCEERAEQADHGVVVLPPDEDGDRLLRSDDGRAVAYITHCPWCGGVLQ